MFRRVLLVESPVLDANERHGGHESGRTQGWPQPSAQRCSKHRRWQVKESERVSEFGGVSRVGHVDHQLSGRGGIEIGSTWNKTMKLLDWITEMMFVL